jgi:sec-independent protein translocase protein TatA
MHMLVVFGIALLIFGPRKLPELGKGLGESIRGFKSAMQAKEEVMPAPAKSDSTTPNPSPVAHEN